MEFLESIFVAPFVEMWNYPEFLAELILVGLSTGVLYSLVALGFVLIFKASGMFNFAQGAMVLFAALTLVGLMEHGVPLWAALLLSMAVMVGLAFAVERLMLRYLVNQEGLILFMATIGLTFMLDRHGGQAILRFATPKAMITSEIGIAVRRLRVGARWRYRHASRQLRHCTATVHRGRSLVIAGLAILLPAIPRSAEPCAQWRTTTRQPFQRWNPV